MIYSFYPDTEAELNASVDYYEECQSDLGLKFAHEVYKTIQRTIEFPNAWQKLDGDIKRCLINRFPFAVIYYQKKMKLLP
jgi:hypothetical protein